MIWYQDGKRSHDKIGEKRYYHWYNKLIELFIVLLGFNVLEKSCGLVDRICPFAGPVSYISFGCFSSCFSRISRNERYKKLIPSWLRNLHCVKRNERFSDCRDYYVLNKKINNIFHQAGNMQLSHSNNEAQTQYYAKQWLMWAAYITIFVKHQTELLQILRYLVWLRLQDNKLLYNWKLSKKNNIFFSCLYILESWVFFKYANPHSQGFHRANALILQPGW